MSIRYMAIIGVTIAASLLVLSASAACSREDPERIAEDVAREWTMTEVEGVSEEIAAMATRRYGGRVFVQIVDDSPSSSSHFIPPGKKPYEGRIPMSADADQIQETIQWEFSPPTKTADGLYEVIATASISFDIVPSESSEFRREMPELHLPMLRAYHRGSVDFNLEVDTTAREVSNAKMPLASVRISRIPQGRNLH